MRTAALSEVSPGLAERATDSPPSAALHIKAVRKFYDELEAIRNVSFDVAGGEFLSLLGPSGCGKSTLLMMVAGLIDATEGEISINGKAVSGPRREVGVVFQQPVLLPWRKVLDNVLFPIELLKLPRAQYEKRAMDLLAMAKIDDFAHHLPRQLSGGMRQRVSICRALIHDPGILLMDEPFSALDALTRDEMGVELLRIWQEAKKTIVFVTHGITEAVFLGTRVIVLTAGPARMADNFRVELPHPRTLEMKTSERFGEYTRRIYRLLGLE